MPAYYLEAFTVILGIVLLMFEAFGPSHSKKAIGLSAAAGLAAILVLLFFVKGPTEETASAPIWENFYAFDSLARFYKGFALVCTALVILMSIDYRSILSRYTDHPGSEAGTGEFYALPVFACAGMMWMASAKDLAGAFVALELVTISFYILVAYMRRNVGSLEAGVKYLILGALSTGFLVYGIAWIYGATGTMNLAAIAAKVQTIENTTPLLFGIGLVLVALGFKIGAVPMQVWIPDVYQGAPTPTTAFLSVGSKAAGFILLIRFLDPLMKPESPVAGPIVMILLLMATATVLFGNFAAIAQTNFKRLLAYSSIAHAGFLILALAAWTEGDPSELGSVNAVSFYLATYLLMTLAAFFVLAQVRILEDSEMIDAFDGLGKRSPMLAVAMTIIMAALAGIPLTVGFWGKFFVFLLAANAGLWWGVILAAIGASAGFYYYFKVIRSMWWNEPADKAKSVELPKISRVCVAALTTAVIVLGVWPQPILWLLG
ncbi:NADH-quinone oxidoreductase subunit N [Haloferula sp.]|uniref:NADH-quinone oxidoreductase subunit N n=1 Tax=Haloferula sp. TaxID=2497595 RepID=UPI003C793E7D